MLFTPKRYEYEQYDKHLSKEDLIKQKQEDFDHNMNSETHANCIIIDKVAKTIERFEPQGSDANNANTPWFDVAHFDKVFPKFISGFLKENKIRWKFTYLPPESYWQGKGIQEKISLAICYLIAFVWIDLRLTFPDISPIELSRILDQELRVTKMDWTIMCESYIFAHKSILSYLLHEERTGKRKGFTRNRFKLHNIPMEEEDTDLASQFINIDITRIK